MTQFDDEDDSGMADREFPDSADMDDAADKDDSESDPCPSCGRPVYEQAERCPYCGAYITPGSVAARHPRWIVITIFVLLVMLVLLGVMWR